MKAVKRMHLANYLFFVLLQILEMDKWSQEPIVADPDKVELTANGKHKGSPSSNCAC